MMYCFHAASAAAGHQELLFFFFFFLLCVLGFTVHVFWSCASCLVVVVDDQSLCTTLKHMMWWKWATLSTLNAPPVRYQTPVELQCFLWNKQGCITSFAPSLAIAQPEWSLQSMSSSYCWCCCSSPWSGLQAPDHAALGPNPKRKNRPKKGLRIC